MVQTGATHTDWLEGGQRTGETGWAVRAVSGVFGEADMDPTWVQRTPNGEQLAHVNEAE